MNRLNYELALAEMRDGFAEEDRSRFDQSAVIHTMSPAVTLGLTYFLGWLGIDRFRLGDWGVGLLKLSIIPLMILMAVFEEGLLIEASEVLVLFITLAATVIWIIIYFDGLFTPGRTRKRNLERLRTHFGLQPPA